MLKANTVFRKKSSLTVEEFQKYWRTTHVDAIKNLPNVRRYVQSHPITELNKPFGYDGLTQIWVDDIGVFKEYASSGRFDAVVEDEENFADRSSVDLHLTDEHVILDQTPPADAIKQVILLKRKPGLSPEEFQRHWLHAHAPLVGTPPGLIRYVQSHVRLGAYRNGKEPTWDGFGEMWYASVADMKAARAAPGQEKVKEDAQSFADVGSTRSFLTREYVMIAS
jgi:uncharacterized protein (TIGR02118 family)